MVTHMIFSTFMVLFLLLIPLYFSMASGEPKPTFYLFLINQILHHLGHNSLFNFMLHSSFHKYLLNIYYVSDTIWSSITQQWTKQIEKPYLHGTYILLATHKCCFILHYCSKLFISTWKKVPSLSWFLANSYSPLRIQVRCHFFQEDSPNIPHFPKKPCKYSCHFLDQNVLLSHSSGVAIVSLQNLSRESPRDTLYLPDWKIHGFNKL